MSLPSPWDLYPKCLPTGVADRWFLDLDHCCKRLSDDAPRLFVSDTEVQMKILGAGRTYQIKCMADLERDEPVLNNLKGSIMYLKSDLHEFTWGKLLVTEAIARRLLTSLGAFPSILDILHTFGQKTSPTSDTLGGYNALRNPVTKRHECCYLLQCVEEHGRNRRGGPWSTRQIGIYAQYVADQHTWHTLILYPKAIKSLDSRLEAIASHSTAFPEYLDTHAMVLGTVTRRWSPYVGWLEQEMHLMTARAHLTTIEGSNSTITVEAIDFQNFHRIQVILQQATHLISTNIETVRMMISDFLDIKNRDLFTNSADSGFRQSLEVCLSDMRLQSRRLDTLSKRAISLSELLQNILAFRGMRETQRNTGMTAKIMELGQKDSQTMLKISKKAHQDSRTLKTITILTLIYLPATFVATLLSMNYVSVGRDGRRPTIDFKPEMWIFAFLTVTLLTITIGLWILIEVRRGTWKKSAHSLP